MPCSSWLCPTALPCPHHSVAHNLVHICAEIQQTPRALHTACAVPRRATDCLANPFLMQPLGHFHDAGLTSICSVDTCCMLCLLQAPANLPSAVGVLVEDCPGSSFLVKVNCRDRHGLLSDITQALCNLPLQVRLCTRAGACCGICAHAHRGFSVLGPAARLCACAYGFFF